MAQSDFCQSKPAMREVWIFPKIVFGHKQDLKCPQRMCFAGRSVPIASLAPTHAKIFKARPAKLEVRTLLCFIFVLDIQRWTAARVTNSGSNSLVQVS